ncbi:hypothetical protein GF314_08625 [bacterium]|nr:hypothetical protein [bacterium]
MGRRQRGRGDHEGGEDGGVAHGHLLGQGPGSFVRTGTELVQANFLSRPTCPSIVVPFSWTGRRNVPGGSTVIPSRTPAIVALALALAAASATATVLDPPRPAGLVDTDGLAFGVDVDGSLAVVCDHTAGLVVLDLADPADPQPRGTLDTPGAARNVVVRDGLAYVADRAGDLRLVDVTDPDQPVEVGAVALPGIALGVDVAGAVAYVAAKGFGLQIVDVSDPAQPTVIGAVDTPGFASDVAVVGTVAYVADFAAGLRVIDVSDPTAPVEIGSYDTAGDANGVAVSGPLAVVADFSGGVVVLDVTTPAAPALRGVLPTGGLASEVVLADPDLALVADGSGGLLVVSLADPDQPALVTSYQTVDATVQLALVGRYVALACGEGGLETVEVFEGSVTAPAPVATLALTAAPNPFNPRTVLRLRSPGGMARLALYDVVGREVRVLREGVLPAGEVRVPVSADGLASGVYLARLELGGRSGTTRLVLVR